MPAGVKIKRNDSVSLLLNYNLIIPLVVVLGFAPYFPQPHIVEKLRMLISGTLHRPIDIFDLIWHAWPFVLLVIRIGKDLAAKVH
jgi:hypothetical protein